MTDEDKPELFSLIAKVQSFYGKDISPFALSVWWAACRQFDLDQVCGALNSHAIDPESGVYPPKPADVVRMLRGTATDRSRQAWGKVMDAMQRVGAYRSVVFDDAVIHAVIEDLGGWMKLCRSDMADLSYTEHRFCESYRAYVNRPSALERYPSLLLGQFEIENSLNGRLCSPPVLLGDPVKARNVLTLGSSDGRQQITVMSAFSELEEVRRLEDAG